MRGRHKTDIEVIMEKALIEAKINYVNEFPIRGAYILDFVIPELKINIECDGEPFHLEGNSYDRKRNWFLRNRGWTILRFKGNDIREDIQSCISKIKETIERRYKENEEN